MEGVKMKLREPIRAENNSSSECPNCGSQSVATRKVVDRFTYGTGADAVQLEAEVPFHRCAECAFEYTDAEAEDRHHEAVCRHLNVLFPEEIRELRDSYDMTRAEFAQATRIGEASLGRWETGQLIQNPANDNYLYLLNFRDNWERLKARFMPQTRLVRIRRRRFSTLDETAVDCKRHEGRGFLRRTVG
jgi:DNA-binding transcriptional regulator YiaG